MIDTMILSYMIIFYLNRGHKLNLEKLHIK